ncbi:putative dimethylaniline monooxygenase [Ilyonectria destructans]|nr:putative dimethylaniline monooxygenase [Ilyonectria destructans]
MTTNYDLIVVGAGWFGLAAARTYLELHPGVKLLVIDSASSIGGTWSNDRLYPGLKSNNFFGSYEYPDFPMDEDVYGVKSGEHIPAGVLHRYLTDFATKFGVADRTRLNTKVESIEGSQSGGWLLHVSSSDSRETLETEKLIIATGLTSQPNMPTYAGQENFTSPIFHAKDFCVHRDTISTSKRAVIVGGGKSAYDCAYAFATEADAQVDLIIRPTGQGPVWLNPPYATPFKTMVEELIHTRFMTWFSPCPWGGEDGFGVARGFLHGTTFGRLLVENYWNKLTADTIEANGFNDDSELFKLKPWYSAMWTGSGVGIHNFDSSLWDLVKQRKIRVHLADITKLDGQKVYLTNDKVIETDVVVCATGWKKDSIIDYSKCKDVAQLEYKDGQRDIMCKEADKEILQSFPMLKLQPVLRYERKDSEPLRNYRFIVPTNLVSKRNVAFAGMVSTTSTAMFANAQALWISAFFDNKLKRLPKNQDEVVKETMLYTQFGKWRYPCGYGDSIPDFAFDSLPYVDLLLNDLGIKSQRKATRMAEITEPYKPRDYRGLINEWTEAESKSNGPRGV